MAEATWFWGKGGRRLVCLFGATVFQTVAEREKKRHFIRGGKSCVGMHVIEELMRRIPMTVPERVVCVKSMQSAKTRSRMPVQKSANKGVKEDITQTKQQRHESPTITHLACM